MTYTGRIRSWIMACLFLIPLLLFAAAPAQAAGSNTISAVFMIDQSPAQNVSFQLYHVAKPNFQWQDDYAGYHIDVDWDSESSVSSAAGVLADYIQRDQKPFAAESRTDEYGKVTFTGLSNGVYLLTGASFSMGDYTYYPVPVLFSLPLSSSEVQVKYESQYHGGSGGGPSNTINMHVLKVWDDGQDENRPQSISVQLLRNGQVYDTQVLSPDNNWRYTWTALSNKFRWTILEAEIPSGYEVSYETQGSTTVLTNKQEKENPVDPTDPPEPTDPPGPTDPPAPTDPPKPTDPAKPAPSELPVDPTPEEKLPQTGLMWEPVFVLAGFSILALTAALVAGRKSKILRYTLIVFGSILLLIASVWTGSNIAEERLAGQSAAKILSELNRTQSESVLTNSQQEVPDYQIAPEMEMPAVTADDGRRYVGILSIPAFEIELPILEEYNEIALKSAPCLYRGSIYTEDAIIAGHNYKSHFGPIHNLIAGETVSFTDMDGNQFLYQVSEVEVIDGTDVDGLSEGDWDLSLFTCTLDRAHRTVVRCQAVS